jgi:hypothetical protein
VSAPTELDLSALRRGLLISDPGDARTQPGRHSRDTNTQPTDRRSSRPVAILAREHDQVCREAVDSAEIAASLEAAGVNDRVARETYGVGNVFELADSLFGLVPRRLSGQSRPRDPWRYPISRHLRRGILYALPTLPYLAAIRVLSGSASGVLTLLCGSLLAMSATHGLSYVGHLLVGYGSYRRAARRLRQALVLVVVGGGAVVLSLHWLVGLDLGPAAVAYGELVYVVAATVIMVFEREMLLFCVLLPAVALATLGLMLPDLSPTAQLALFVMVGVCITITVAGGWYTATRFERLRNSARVRLVRPEVHRAFLHALYGACCAGLLMYAVLDALTFPNVFTSNAIMGIGMVPLVATLGVTEWNLHAFRSDTEAVLHRTYEFHAFARAVRWSLLSRFASYALVLISVTAAILRAFAIWAPPSPVLFWRHVGYDVLGLCLFLATILVSCGLLEKVLQLLVAALVADLALRVAGPDQLPQLTIAHCVVFTGLLLALAATAYRQLASPLRYR